MHRLPSMGAQKNQVNNRLVEFDKLFIAFSIIYPFTMLPQVYRIFSTKSAGDISIISWSLLILFTVPFLVHSSLRKDKSLIVNYSLWMVMYVATIAGAVAYS